MARKVASLTTFSITQYLNIDFWKSANEDLKEILEDKDSEMLTMWIVERLESQGWEVEKAYSIIHDKDSREVWNESLMKMVNELKESHFHGSFKFVKGKNEGATLGNIARAIGVEKQFIEKPKAGRFSWDNQLSYLIHAKDKNKYPYNPEEVFTYKGRDYMSIYHENVERWNRGAIAKQNRVANEDVDWLESMILNGEVVRSEVFLNDEYFKIYSLNKRRIEDAFDTYGQRKMYEALAKLENGDFATRVVYIMGQAGSGKTVTAKKLARQAVELAKRDKNEDWRVTMTASTNPVDDYQGEEVLIMDDVRGSSMRADDWLKLLDPWNVSPSSARYRNKIVTARLIIITATIHPAEFFYYSKGVGRGDVQAEAVDQFLRRLMAIMEVYNLDEMEILRPLTANSPVRMRINSGNYLGNDIYVHSNIDLKKDDNLSAKRIDEAVKDLADEIVNGNV